MQNARIFLSMKHLIFFIFNGFWHLLCNLVIENAPTIPQGSKRRLKMHSAHHTGDRYPCTECEATFSSKRNLTAHAVVHTGQRNKHKCLHCKKEFSQKGNLTVHMLTHSGQKNFACDICAAAFSQKSNLKVPSDQTFTFCLRLLKKYNHLFCANSGVFMTRYI